MELTFLRIRGKKTIHTYGSFGALEENKDGVRGMGMSVGLVSGTTAAFYKGRLGKTSQLVTFV